MQKIVLLLMIMGFGMGVNFAKGTPPDRIEKVIVRGGNSDDEYDRYKKRADDFFDKGDYSNALRQYRNCLEVPTYENDPYAQGRIALVENLIKLRQDAYQALNAGKGEEAVGLFEKMMVENPKDSITKVNLTDYWTGEATKSYAQQDYEKAKVQYQEALKYATKPALIQIQIQNSDAFIKQKAEQMVKTAAPATIQQPESKGTFEPPINPIGGKDVPAETRRKPRVGIKIATAVVGLGAGAYAYTLNNQYQTKLDEVNRIGKTVDPDGDNVILTSGEYNQWQTAYKATTDSRQNRSKFVAALGVVGVAAITEVVLLMLPKSGKSTGFSAGASSQQLGLAVRYTFR